MTRTSCCFLFCFLSTSAFAQLSIPAVPPKNWQLMDLKQDGYPGISLEKAYKELLKNRKPLKKIIVAIIDDGSFDANNPDLAGIEWTNKKEIPGNGIDDDHNGFMDDVHGWSFTGDKLKYETFKEIREYVRLRKKYENTTDTATLNKDPQYSYWKDMAAEKDRLFSEWKKTKKALSNTINNISLLQDYWSKKLGQDTVYPYRIKDLSPGSSAGATVLKIHSLYKLQMMYASPKVTFGQIISDNKFREKHLDDDIYSAEMVIEKNDPAYFRKKDFNDDPYTNDKKNYGNPNTTPIRPEYTHGLQIAGIIAALRNNHLGINGISNSVAIMPIKQYILGCEWDKDVANAIRYAVDNGAKIVNMSFSKYESPQKEWVDEAIRYAEKKGVLLVVAASNEMTDVDAYPNYPGPVYNDKTYANNLLTVGASSFDSLLVAQFSNYGATKVDVFAPGVYITTTGLNNTYKAVDGTSFSTPVVVGLAAFIWSYFPNLTCKQVKYCIERSATPIKALVSKPGTNEKVPFSSLSKTGGIVNAYNAILIAQTFTKKR